MQPTWLDYGDATNTVRIIGILIPLITAALTRSTASRQVKSITTTVLSILTGSVAYLVAANGHGYNWAGFVNAVITTFVAAVASYYGFHKPTGLAPAIAKSTASVGIGDPNGRAADGARQLDGGYATLATLGFVLVFVGVILLILSAIKVFAVSLAICVVLIIIGVVLWLVGGRSSTP